MNVRKVLVGWALSVVVGILLGVFLVECCQEISIDTRAFTGYTN